MFAATSKIYKFIRLLIIKHARIDFEVLLIKKSVATATLSEIKTPDF